jgi:RimJ/RimL family protein N-acetyltransferase
MDRQPTLTGDLVVLRPTTEADREPLFAIASDRLIWEVHPAYDRWQRPVFDAFFDAGQQSGGALTILDRATGAIIGSSRYGLPDLVPDEIEIGWTYIARAYWGGVYNPEIKRLMLDHLHRFVGTATFMVGKDNIRSRKAMEKIGGVLRDGEEMRLMAGEQVAHVIYEIRRTAF